MTSSERSMRELVLLRERLSAIVSPVRAGPRDTERLRRSIEERAERIRLRHRVMWAMLATVASALGAALVLARVPADHALHWRASRGDLPAMAVGRQSVVNHSKSATVYDLGPNVGKLLVRPDTAFAYDPPAHSVELVEGSIVAHIQPGGRGFRVMTSAIVVEVTGTLFGVATAGDAVRVWHGSVVRSSRSDPSNSQVVTGDEQYDDLRPEELSWLSFDAPAREGARRSVASACPEPSASAAAAGAGAASPRRATARSTPPLALPALNPERRLLLDAQTRLAAGLAPEALELLAEHERLYPGSTLAEERDLLSLRALVLTHDAPALARQVERFLERHPRSSRAMEVRRLSAKE